MSQNWLRAFLISLIPLAILFCLGQAEDHLRSGVRVDKVLLRKKQHTLELLDHGKMLKKYKVALGSNPVGPTTQQGDHKTPEGIYILDHRNEHSQFYRSVHIFYPNSTDRARAQKLGVAPGSDIMTHGVPNGYGWIGSAHRAKDWTDGRVAVTNEEMDEIWRMVPDGTPVEITP
jgi:murein L,D-transpeptidase YafK